MNTNRKQSLSVCLIVKNEEKLLPGCLESIADLADQLLIVDTGSTDGTLEISKSFDAEIHHFKWVDDFSAARNESIKYARGDWVLWIDADERLNPESVVLLRELLIAEAKPVIYRVRIKNLKEDGVNFTLSDAHRLFTNHRGIQFSGKIHEQISPSASRQGAVERDSNIVLDHLGYSFEGQAKLKKQDRNRTILEAEVQDNPRSAHAHYTLAHTYKLDERFSDAEAHYRKALALKQFDSAMEASLLNALADTLLELNRTNEALPLIDRSIKLGKIQNAAYLMQYKIAAAQENWDDALQNLQAVQDMRQKIDAEGSSISTDIEVQEAIIWQTMAEIFSLQKAWVKAAECYEKPFAGGVRSIKMLRGYFKVLERQQDWPKALDILTELVKIEGELPTYLSAIGSVLIRMGEHDGALQTYLHHHRKYPDDLQVKKNISVLYQKLGQNEKAKEWL